MPEISDNNISRAWLKAVNLANISPRKEVSNLIVSVEDIQSNPIIEIEGVRAALDDALEMNGNFPVSTVANTIFPSSLWKKDKPRDFLYERYLNLWPRISAHKQNRRGTYFQRLIGYPKPGEPTFNQLEFVISAFNSGTHRRSALQCGILVPHADLNATPYQGFPCMQQLAFLPEGKDGLRVSALYPMHYLWARAYGNYLGLINLGRFVAREMGLELRAMTCIALIAKLDKPDLAVSLMEAIDEI
jgi:hypothetical protein